MHRIFVALLFLAGTLGLYQNAVLGAEGFGNKPIRWVVPYAPGGGVDVLTRALAREVSKDLSVTVIVQNIPGGGARIGTSYVYRGKPDGHTLGTFVNGSLIIPQILFDDAPYDVRKLVWIASPFSAPFGVWVKTQSPVRTLKDFKKLGRPVWIGESGITASPVPATILLMRSMGVDYEYVTGYGGQAVMNPAVIRGELDMFTRTYPSQRPWKDDTRSLVTMDTKRHPLGKDVPTVEEVAGAEVAKQVLPLGSGTYLIAASPGTPSKTADALEQAVLKALQTPRFVEWAKKAGFSSDLTLNGRARTQKIVDDFITTLEKNAATLKEVMTKK